MTTTENPPATVAEIIFVTADLWLADQPAPEQYDMTAFGQHLEDVSQVLQKHLRDLKTEVEVGDTQFGPAPTWTDWPLEGFAPDIVELYLTAVKLMTATPDSYPIWADMLKAARQQTDVWAFC